MSTSSKKRTRRRRKRRNPLVYIFSFLLLIALGIVLCFALRGGYNTFIRSTYKLEHYDTVMQACTDYDVDPALAYAIMRTESKFDENALSSANAKGLMQVADITLEWLQFRSDEFDNVSPDQLFDPVTNIRCGVYTLSLLEELFDSEQAVIAAYNAGVGAVQGWLEDPAYSSDGVTLHTIPYEETRAYVERVQSSKAIYTEYYHLSKGV